MEIENLVLLTIACFLSIVLAYFHYFYKIKERSQFLYWLSFLRALTLFSIFILLINPTLKKIKIETIKPNLLVAVDNSSSIKYGKQTKVVSELLLKLRDNIELNSKFQINYFSFGFTTNVLDSLSFSESTTNIEAPLSEFSKLYKDEISPTVIISDGNQNIGKSVSSSNYKNPVYPFVVGDTSKFEDIFINQLNVNKFSYINNQFPVEVFINYTGNKAITKILSVYQKNQKVFSKTLQFSSQNNVVNESFYLESKESGIQNYSIKIEELANEQNTFNNIKNFSVDIIKEQSKILLLTSVTHPDLGFFKKSIESNKQRLVSIVNIADFKSDLLDFQLVILYQPNNKFKKVLDEITTKNLNFLLVSGLNTDWNFLNKNQGFIKKNSSSQLENYAPIFNTNYATYQINDIGFSNFNPIQDIFGEVKIIIPHNVICYQKIGAINTINPLLATFENKSQKGAFLLGENSWKWRMNSFISNNSFEQFDGFIANLIQFLTINKTSNRLTVYSEPMYYANQSVSISTSYLDNNYVFDERAKLWLTISSKESNFIKKLPFTLNASSFNVSLSDIAAGDYSYTVSVENQLEKAFGKFTILPFELEQQTSTSNDIELKQIANKTKGKLFYNGQEELLIQALLNDNQFKKIQKSSTEKLPLIDFKWLLGILILLLSIEWFVRKYYGKI